MSAAPPARRILSCIGLCLVTAVLLWAAAARADTITPGHITGKIFFTADFIPSDIRVDTINPPYEGTQYPASTLPGSVVQCAPSTSGPIFTSTWCYGIIVESAKTHSYVLRPVATINTPTNTSRISFPEFPAQPFLPSTTPLPTDPNAWSLITVAANATVCVANCCFFKEISNSSHTG